MFRAHWHFFRETIIFNNLEKTGAGRTFVSFQGVKVYFRRGEGAIANGLTDNLADGRQVCAFRILDFDSKTKELPPNLPRLLKFGTYPQKRSAEPRIVFGRPRRLN